MGIFDNLKATLEGASSNMKISTEQTDQEKSTAQKVVYKYREAKSAKAPKVAVWKKCLSAYAGETNNKFPEYKADHNSNFVFSTVETIIPIMTDNDPQFMCIPSRSDFTKIADTVQLAFEYEWRRTRMRTKLPEAIKLSLQIGSFIWGVLWDQNASNGVGEVKPVLINPFNIFPDPMATSFEDAQYVIYACYKPVEELKKQFPDKANLLVAGSIKDDDLVMGTGDTTSVRNAVLVLECWTRDYDEFETVTEQDGDQLVQIQKLKYPNGRVITVTENGILLGDKPNPYNDGKFPFIITKNYQIPFEFWGMSEIEQLLKPQHYINDLNNQIIDNARLTGNMPWIIDKNAGIGEGKLTNRPGLIIRKNPGTEVGRMSPPTMPRYIQDKIDELKRDMEIISGIHDITQGRKPGGITAAAAIEALQEAGQARIRLKVRLMEQSLAELGEMWFSRMKQFWITPRQVQRLNPDFSYSFQDITPDLLEGYVSFYIVAGSTMPVNRTARLQQMIQLAQTPGEDTLPMIDRQAILEAASIPDRDKILQRFAALKQATMMPPAATVTPPGMEGTPQEQMAEGSQEAPVESQEGQPGDPMAEIIQIMSKMPDEMVMKMLQEHPEIAQLIQKMEQPQK